MRSSGSKTGHWPRWPSSMAAYHRPRNWPPPAALSGCTPIRPRMIGGRIFDDTVLVGFALGRSVYVLAAGELACPGCAAPLRSAAGYVPPRGGPSRCGPRPPSAPTPETRCWAPTRGGTPAGRRRRGDGATPRRARSAVCRVAARPAADLLVHRRAAPVTRPSGCSTRRTGQDRGRRQRAYGPRHHAVQHGSDESSGLVGVQRDLADGAEQLDAPVARSTSFSR